MILYYITDSTKFAGTQTERHAHLLNRISEAAELGIDFIQLRERHLATHDLETLARKAVESVKALSSSRTRLLVNSRPDIALAAGADGVHLRSKDVSPRDVRSIWQSAGRTTKPIIAVSCHSGREVTFAAEAGADFVVFGPVFGKAGSPQVTVAGLELLRSACNHSVPVLALGGVSTHNADLCIQAGSAGVAGIRLFQQGDLAGTITRLRSLQRKISLL